MQINRISRIIRPPISSSSKNELIHRSHQINNWRRRFALEIERGLLFGLWALAGKSDQARAPKIHLQLKIPYIEIFYEVKNFAYFYFEFIKVEFDVIVWVS